MNAAASKIIVTGGAGYLGRCMVDRLQANGLAPVIFDNFSTGHRDRVEGVECIEVDLADAHQAAEAFNRVGEVRAVIHFAAKALVGESCQQPAVYFKNNLLATIHTADLCVKHRIPSLIHSSSCSVYGVPQEIPITEEAPHQPLSPYGETKSVAERLLHQMHRHQGLKVLNLRYFNPGGSLGGKFGEHHEPETHLIPRVVSSLLQDAVIEIFGDDYPTPDGTCIRDFIHVSDLVDAHLRAINVLESGREIPQALNVGTGQGVSVRQLIQCAEKVLDRKARVDIRPRRPGDAPKLVASGERAKAVLGWAPKLSLEDIIKDHYLWIRRNTPHANETR
jgi:UDP-glucose-4-epimerase GalE